MVASRAIVVDDEDWTRALERPCPPRGSDAHDAALHDVPVPRRDLVGARQQVPVRVGVAGSSPPDRWSPPEQFRHLRDPFRILGARLRLMPADIGATVDNGDQDATAVDDRCGLPGT